jgi:hypothetical protein
MASSPRFAEYPGIGSALASHLAGGAYEFAASGPGSWSRKRPPDQTHVGAGDERRVLNDPSYITGAGPDTSVLIGAFLEVLLIIANIGTAVALFPVVKRQHEVLALGYVTARLVECGFIAVGILSLVTIVTLRQEAANADAATLILVVQTLVTIHDWTFLLGPRLGCRRGQRADARVHDVPPWPGGMPDGWPC